MKVYEKLWLAIFIITFFMGIPCLMILSFNLYVKIWAITMFSEIIITVLYCVLFKITHHKY